MLTKYSFELELERLAEKFFFNAASTSIAIRGGNSKGNEAYFGWISPELRQRLSCQQLILNKGECPDSGVFGEFNYKPSDEIPWEKVKSGEMVAIEVVVPNDQKRYFVFSVNSLKLPEVIVAPKGKKREKKSADGKIEDSNIDSPDEVNEVVTDSNRIKILLNSCDLFGDFFGVEYKASLSSNEKSISVASFNSTCPSSTKTVEINTARLIHNLPTKMRSKFENDPQLKVVEITLEVQFQMYYLIINDANVNNTSKIRHIFICSGSFFAPDLSETAAYNISREKKPSDFNVKVDLYKVKMRYRPFFRF